MKNIKLVIFDLDGTLADAYEAITRSFNYTMKEHGYPAQDPLVIRRAVGWGDRNLLGPFVKKCDLHKALSVYRRHHRLSLLKYSRLIKGALRILGYLKTKNYQLAVASNRPTRFSRIMLRHLKLDRYFAYILCADKLKHGKPHPEILQRIMRRLSVRPQETVYVGDMPIDAEAARRATIKAVIVTGGSGRIKEIRAEKPYRVIRNILTLRDML
jgi:phosphoglycolate phosphatase-like HAD superfamily hydrolase